MATNKIECDVQVTSACIKELKSLYSDLNGIKTDITIQSTGDFTSELKNTIYLMSTYKTALLSLIEISQGFAATVLTNFQNSDADSTVSVSPDSSPVINPGNNQTVTTDTENATSSDDSTHQDSGDVESHFDYVWTGPCVDDEFKRKVIEISEKLDCDPDDLMAVMAFESGLDSAAVNKVSGATGLIQFMPETARGLGTSVEELRNMDKIRQLDYVYEYLKNKKGKLNNIEDMYMAVLWPAACGKPSDTVIFDQNSSSSFIRTCYKQNRGLDINNDGTVTKSEACRMVIRCRDRYTKK